MRIRAGFDGEGYAVGVSTGLGGFRSRTLVLEGAGGRDYLVRG